MAPGFLLHQKYFEDGCHGYSQEHSGYASDMTSGYIKEHTVLASIVTDTFLIAKFVHAFTYVVRANFIDKRNLYFLENCSKENKFPNLSLLLNYTNNAIKYGYESEAEKNKKKWFR